MPSETLTYELLDEEYNRLLALMVNGDSCEAEALRDYVEVCRARVLSERDLLNELPEGFVIERSRVSRSGDRPIGFELTLFDARRRPRRKVASVARRYIGRPLVQWSSLMGPGSLVDPEAAVALAVALRLAAGNDERD